MGVPIVTKWRTKTGNNALNDPVTGQPIVGVDVDIRVIEGSKGLYKESWKADGNSTTLIMDVAWNDRKTFRRHMLGYTKRYFDPGTMQKPVLLRYLAERNEDDLTQYCVACEMIDCYPHGGQNSFKWPKYERAVYQCVFQATPWIRSTNSPPINGVPQDTDETRRMVYWRRRWNSREQKIPGLWFTNEAVPQPLKDIAFRPNTQIEWQCTWYEIPIEAIPSSIIETRPSFVNNGNFTIFNPDGSGVVYPAETVMFKGAEEKRYYTAEGSQVADLTYLYGVRREGWNFFPNANGDLVLATKDGAAGSARIFKQRDLSLLYQPV